MKNKIIFGVLFGIILLTFVSADEITLGYKGISINNQITNIPDFPDYVFVTYGNIEGMCGIKKVKETGEIERYYKFCNPSVYAIPKDNFEKFNTDYIIESNKDYRNFTKEQIIEQISLIKGKEVIKNIQTYKQIPISSTIEEINNFYTIDLNQIKTEPDNKETTKNNLVYFYILIPIVALLIIIWIIVRRRK